MNVQRKYYDLFTCILFTFNCPPHPLPLAATKAGAREDRVSGDCARRREAAEAEHIPRLEAGADSGGAEAAAHDVPREGRGQVLVRGRHRGGNLVLRIRLRAAQ